MLVICVRLKKKFLEFLWNHDVWRSADDYGVSTRSQNCRRKKCWRTKSLFELSVLQKWSIGSLFYSRSPWDRAPWIRRDTSCHTHSTLPLHNNSTKCRVCRNKLHEFSPTNLNSAHYSLREIIFEVVGLALTPPRPMYLAIGQMKKAHTQNNIFGETNFETI